MKKKFLAGILSFMLAVQPAAICQAEEVSGSETTASETTDSETVESEAGSSEAAESEPEGDSSTTPVTGEDQTSVEDVEDQEEVTDAEDGYAASGEDSQDGDVVFEDVEEDAYTDLFSSGENEETKSYDAGNGITATLVNGVFTVSGSGAMKDFEDSKSAPWKDDVGQISTIIISPGITRVGNYSFIECGSLREISLPEGLVSIGEAAFYNAYNLHSVTLPQSLQVIGTAAFADCINLETLNMGSQVREVGQYAFQQTSITAFHFPASLTTYDPLAFFGSSISQYTADSQNPSFKAENGVLFTKDGTTLLDYPTGKRDTSYAIPNGVVTVGDSAFIKNAFLQQISIPATVTTIGDWAFARSGLTSLVIPDTVTTIGSGIAQECRSLVTASVGNGVAVLPYRTFEQCTSLTTVTLGSNIKEFDTRIFFNCTALTSVNLPEGLENIDVADFWGCKSLTYLKVPSTVKKIEAGAFSGCTNLNVDYPSHLTQMEDGSYMMVETLYYSGNYHYDDAYRVLDIVNQERGKEGLAPLAMDESLLESAMQRAAETCLDFSHTRPTGMSCFTANKKASGENIAAGSSSATGTMNQWMNSAGHRANIMSSEYKTIGIGCFEQGGTKFWVQMFGTEETAAFLKPADKKVRVAIPIDPQNYQKSFYLEWEDGGTANMSQGQKRLLCARIENPGWDWVYSTPDPDSFTWTSSNPSVAKVDSEGNVTAVAEGKAVITVSGAGLSGSVNVAVKGKLVIAAKTIRLNRKTLSLLKGKQAVLKATTTPARANETPRWRSSNTKVAVVSKTGKVTAKGKGKAVITATLSNGKKASCTVTVREIPAKRIRLNLKSITAYKGYRFTVKGRLTPGNSTDRITWRSSNTKVAVVSSKGVVRLKANGRATITARTTSGKKATLKVRVGNRKKVVKK